MQIDIITLFPEMFAGPFDHSIVKRAQEQNKVEINLHNLRDWAIDQRGTVDEKPYGGGPGMILRPEPIFNAVEEIQVRQSRALKNKKSSALSEQGKIILLDAGGKLYNQQKAKNLAKQQHLILICGHYEGVDYRVHKHLADEVLSIGDYVLTGGEIPAMTIADSIIRLLPGVISPESKEYESFSIKNENCELKIENLLEYPHYTRPEEFQGHKVPDILLSGHHEEIAKWRGKQALKRTKRNRPDLLK